MSSFRELGVSSTKSWSPRLIPPKRSFADFDELDASSPRPGTTKRLRIETEEADREGGQGISISSYGSQRLIEKFVQTIQQQQQPKPLPLKRLQASFLEGLDEPINSSIALKRYRFKSVDNFVTQWIESTSGSESYRGRHCRSDTLITHSDGITIPRRLTKSAPNMEFGRDTDGFALPPTPASTR